MSILNIVLIRAYLVDIYEREMVIQVLYLTLEYFENMIYIFLLKYRRS